MGYGVTPGDKCIFDLTDDDVMYLLESYELTHGRGEKQEQAAKTEQLRSGDQKFIDRVVGEDYASRN